MDLETLRHLLLLRPLIVFLSAAPLVAVAGLVGWLQERRRERRATFACESQIGERNPGQETVSRRFGSTNFARAGHSVERRPQPEEVNAPGLTRAASRLQQDNRRIRAESPLNPMPGSRTRVIAEGRGS